MSKTDPGIFKLLDDMRISSERILATLEGQTRESLTLWPRLAKNLAIVPIP